MLNEEEIESIKALKSYINAIETFGTIDYKCINNLYEPTKTVLNLITKLQKENEHWKNKFEEELEDNRKKTCELLKQDLIIREKDKQIEKALDLIFNYGQIDGEHHKTWVIDQIVRALTGKNYDKWINNYIYDEETGDCYTWNKGIAP